MNEKIIEKLEELVAWHKLEIEANSLEGLPRDTERIVISAVRQTHRDSMQHVQNMIYNLKN